MSYGFTREVLEDLHYAKNLTTIDISKIFTCHRDSVTLALKRFGLIPRGHIKKGIDKSLANQLIDLYVNKNMSLRQIAKTLKTDHCAVSRKLKALGIKIDDRFAALSSKRNPDWNGGKTIASGYSIISSIIICGIIGKQEHRYIMECYLGRKLLDNEVIHHIDKNKLNNDISNLQLMTNSEHTTLHMNERWKNNVK